MLIVSYKAVLMFIGMFILPVLLELVNQLTECRPLLREQLPALTHCQLIPAFCKLKITFCWLVERSKIRKKEQLTFFLDKEKDSPTFDCVL